MIKQNAQTHIHSSLSCILSTQSLVSQTGSKAGRVSGRGSCEAAACLCMTAHAQLSPLAGTDRGVGWGWWGWGVGGVPCTRPVFLKLLLSHYVPYLHFIIILRITVWSGGRLWQGRGRGGLWLYLHWGSGGPAPWLLLPQAPSSRTQRLGLVFFPTQGPVNEIKVSISQLQHNNSEGRHLESEHTSAKFISSSPGARAFWHTSVRSAKIRWIRPRPVILFTTGYLFLINNFLSLGFFFFYRC